MAGNKFQFRLEAVLKLRRLEAEQAKTQLGHAIRAVAEARLQLEKAQSELDREMTQARAGDAVHDLRRFAEARAQLMDRCRDQTKELERCQQAELKARTELGARMRDQQALEDLREDQLRAYRDQRDRSEQQTLDELGVIGHGRKSHLPAVSCE